MTLRYALVILAQVPIHADYLEYQLLVENQL